MSESPSSESAFVRTLSFARSDEGLTPVTSALEYFYGGKLSHVINSLDETKLSCSNT